MNKYIGVSGVARAGKNLFCDILIKQLDEKYKIKAKQYSLAYELKMDCKEFIWEKLGLDAFSENTEHKKVFREMLVWYGDVKRKQSNGTYWIQKLETRISKDFENLEENLKIAIISDIRYDFYELDEVSWIKNKHCPLIHISKYSKITNKFVQPANDHEKINDPKLRAKADYLLEWWDVSENSSGVTQNELLTNTELNQEVEKCLTSISQKYNILSS